MSNDEPDDNEPETREDEFGEYEVDAGTAEPTEGRCNAVLRHWQSRYGERRYCGQLPQSFFNEDYSDRCKTHLGRDNLDHDSDHALYSKTILHAFDHLSPDEQVRALVLYEGLLEESVYDFGDTMVEKTIDFSRDSYEYEIPDVADGDGKLIVEVSSPAENIIRALPLWRAAVNEVIMTNINVEIAINDLTKEKVVASKLIRPSPDNDLDEPMWVTLKEEQEHHLCLPYHRLIGEQKHLLERGGVPANPTEEVEEVDSTVEIDMTLVNDPLASDDIQPEGFTDLDSARIPVTGGE